ncbi:nucleoside recognition domain-containing protein [Zongyangia hominis]|uniref:Spore maturation protein A n=1 Tax=Zongyangia hominis TaxID=2763677 RepID=A0A926EDF2_9FIRM|nr:nucleoside recognition domain-containing protein [Zongyangia hominis]MBC8571028.1 spore maturation protein A [Zongyangia hominis]
MTWIFCVMIGLSFLFGALTGRMPQVSQAAISSCSEAVKLVITLLGTMCLWSGLMKVADECRITDGLAKLFSPINKHIFKGLDQKSKAAKAICMNMAANLLGLGNAATPLGMAAMRELEKLSPDKTMASDHMVTFVVLNTASLQLIPTTIAALRLEMGAKAPLDILPAVWVTSLSSIVVALLAARFFGMFTRPKGRPQQGKGEKKKIVHLKGAA